MNWLKRIGLGKKDPSTPRQAPSLGKAVPSIRAERLRDSPILSTSAQTRKESLNAPIETSVSLDAAEVTAALHPAEATEATKATKATEATENTKTSVDSTLGNESTPAVHPENDLSTKTEAHAPVRRENPAMRILRRGRQRTALQTQPSAEAKHSASPRKKSGRAVESIALGVTFNKSDFWLRLLPDGTGENLNISNMTDSDAAHPKNILFFRLTEYDKGILFSKKLRGKNLRNAMIREREISDIPASFLDNHIRWFTRKSTVQIAHQPVHPLGTSLFAYAKAQGWHPEKGVLLYTGIRMQDSTLWIYLAVGKNGIGTPQVAHINAEADRPLFNMTYSAGLLPNKDYETYPIPPEVLFQWLSTHRHRRYPQPDEWLGLERMYVGRWVMALGITACLAGGALWWLGNGALHTANLDMARVRQETTTLHREKQTFLRAHLPVIAYSFKIPLDKDLQAAFSLWKPGTHVILADGLPLPFNGGGFQSPMMTDRAPQRVHAPAKIAIVIPESKNLGDGQSTWVSPKILSAVIQQPALDGFHLQHIIRKSTGGGYVVIFGRSR